MNKKVTEVGLNLPKIFFLVALSNGIHEITNDKLTNPVKRFFSFHPIPFGALILAVDMKPFLKVACSVFFLSHLYTLPKTDAKGDKAPVCRQDVWIQRIYKK